MLFSLQDTWRGVHGLGWTIKSVCLSKVIHSPTPITINQFTSPLSDAKTRDYLMYMSCIHTSLFLHEPLTSLNFTKCSAGKYVDVLNTGGRNGLHDPTVRNDYLLAGYFVLRFCIFWRRQIQHRTLLCGESMHVSVLSIQQMSCPFAI